MTTELSPDGASIQSTSQSTISTNEPKLRKPLRLWPGIIGAVLVIVGWFILPAISSSLILYGMLAELVGLAIVVAWWLFFSRAPWLERLGALVFIVLALIITRRFVHESIAGGAMGALTYVLAIPIVAPTFVAWAVATRRLTTSMRRLALVVTVILSCGFLMLLQTGGFTAELDNDFHWRWSKTHEQLLVAQGDEPSTLAAASVPTTATAEWPGFRGAERNSVVRGTRIKTDWTASPPVEIWRRPIGPGWSSFAVHGDFIYTQEQRGSDEIVACYELKSGKPVWKHRDGARFWESNGGPGPRGTPTLSNGRVYTLGATGIVNVLDETNGNVIWSRNAASDTGSKLPWWGFSSSPLIVDDLVVVATAGKLVAYEISTGKPRWFGPEGGGGYSSPQLLTIANVPQIVFVGQKGAVGVAPSDGKVLWEHAWEGVPIVQPAIAPDGSVLISVSESSGVRSLAVANNGSSWTAQERWTSEGLNPYFNDFVVHNGYAFGFDWSSLACIDLKDGNRKWKGGRFGHGQMVLLPDQDLLLLISEQGELGLVKATPDGFTELARFQAIKGKTWNHPVLAGDVLLVRNGEEMAAFRLPLS